jgi:hypothetical protein
LNLGAKQRLFTRYVGMLIAWAYKQGLELTFGDAYRSPEQAAANFEAGKGIANSLHCQRLAVDFNLFINGQYITNSDAYKPLGEYWESLDPLCRWGGRFKKPDGNHFSLSHEGVS